MNSSIFQSFAFYQEKVLAKNNKIIVQTKIAERMIQQIGTAFMYTTC
jgi:hypothetical protein